MMLRDYQVPAVNWLYRQRYGLVESPAGSGKTIIAAAALSKAVLAKPRTKKVKVGWIANTIEQVQQANTALSLFPKMLPWVDLKVQCAAGMPDMRDRDVLVIDECQHASAESWEAIITSCPGALWFFSATPFGDDDLKNDQLNKMCRGNIFQVSRESIKNNLAAASVIMLSNTDPCGQVINAAIESEMKKNDRMLKWMIKQEVPNAMANFSRPISEPDMKSAWAIATAAATGKLYSRIAFRICMDIGVVENQKRNQVIIDLADAHINNRDSVLILVNTIEHGEKLLSGLPPGSAVLAHSKMGKKNREETINDFKNGKLHCMIATSLADEGLDVPRANVLIMACAGRSSGRVEQRTGRVLRSFQGKSHGTIYDFEDKQHRLLANQSMKRQGVYRRLGYKFEQPS